MTLTEKISSLTDLELAELWNLNWRRGHSIIQIAKMSKNDRERLDQIYKMTRSISFRNQHKEIIEAMRAEIVKRYLNQNQIR